MIIRTRHFVAIAITLLLAGLFAIGGYRWYQISHLELPVNNIFAAVSTGLPILTAFAVYYLSKRKFEGFLASFGLLILDAVVVTLSATYLPPDTKDCQLSKRWTDMYRVKSPAIKQIQDALQCCGFKSTYDKFYPFPIGADPDRSYKYRCEVTYPNRKGHSCYSPWSMEQEKSAIIFLVIASVGAFVKIISLVYLKYYRFAEPILNKPLVQTAAEESNFTDADYEGHAAHRRDAGVIASGNRNIGYDRLESERLLEHADHEDGHEGEDRPWSTTGVMHPSSQTYS